MKEKILFKKHLQKSSFHNPMMDNALDNQELEIRIDPLTEHQSVFNSRLQDKVDVFFGPSDHALIKKLAHESEPVCFLCEDKWKKMTPTYPEKIVPNGRICVGQAVLFPNLFPVAQVHAVIRVGALHYLPLKNFEPLCIAEAFQASVEFAKALSRADIGVDFLTINGNYLGPAGASIAHPHFQIVGGDFPFTHLKKQIDQSKKYFIKNKSCYWKDLVAKEKEIDKRYIGETGPVSWIASFAPQGTNEVLGILTEKNNFLEMDKEDINGLAKGVSKVLKGYDKMGHSTFNFSIYSGPLNSKEDAFCCYIRIITRQNVYENYRTDDYFLQKLLENELILTPPEVLASTLW